MSLGNTTARYGAISKTFHWLTALLILTMIPLGMIANAMAHDIRDPAISSTDADVARTALLFSLHKTIGVATFLVALVRISWALSQPKPGLLHPQRRVEALAAETVHWLLYGSLVLVPLTGWVHHSATTGFAPIWWPFGQSLPFVPKSEAVAGLFAGLHIVLVRVMAVALALHVAGALKHHFMDRDATLWRIWPGQRDVPQPPAQSHSIRPVFAALSVWALTISIGAGLGSYKNHTQPAAVAPAALQQVASDWRVSEGTLDITVTQLGNQVSGRFEDWTAAITFDDPDAPGPAGQVDVTIAITSLSLGSVAAQAMGPDFFDAQTFPTATFTGQISKTQTGYIATGPLTIRDISLPVTLPFSLVLDSDTATMSGSLTLNRLDYGVGASLPDEKSVGFTVEVSAALTASRAQADN